MGKTVDEIVVASVVELETKLVEDKANAASVFYNLIASVCRCNPDITRWIMPGARKRRC